MYVMNKTKPLLMIWCKETANKKAKWKYYDRVIEPIKILFQAKIDSS